MGAAFSHAAYARIAALFTARTGILCPLSRIDGVESGIKRAQHAAQIPDAWDYLDRLARSTELLDGLIRELATGETYFFRDSDQLQSLRTAVLPELVGRLGPAHRLRIWSAGCSTGEEAYSLAMLLDQEGLLAHCDMLATDINPVALAQARTGSYREWSMREVDESMRARYFQQAGDRICIAERIRAAVRFELHNLLSAGPPAAAGGREAFDLILCRNVVIYFDLAIVKEVAERFYDYLAPGGWLLMGASDAPLWDYAPFAPVRLPGGVMYCKGAPSLPSLTASLTQPAEVSRSSPDIAPQPEAPGLLDLPAGPSSGEASEDAAAQPSHSALLTAVQAIAAQHGAEKAWSACMQAAAQHPFQADFQILSAMLLCDLGRWAEARSAARRAIYLDRDSPLAHYVLGTIAERLEDPKEALLSFRNARDCAAALPKHRPIPLFEGGRAGQLSKSARMRLMLLTHPATSGKDS